MRIWVLIMLSATLAFGQAKPEDAMQKCRGILKDAVADHNPDVRKGAAEALSLVGVKDIALDLLAPMLDDHDVTVRVAVVNTLGDLKENQTLVIPLLNKALVDPVPEVDFAAAAHVVAMHPYPELRENLVPLLDDKKQAVQVRAAAAYIRLQHETKAPPAKHHSSTHRAPTAAPAKTTRS